MDDDADDEELDWELLGEYYEKPGEIEILKQAYRQQSIAGVERHIDRCGRCREYFTALRAGRSPVPPSIPH